MNLSLNQALHRRVTMYATEAEERTGETIYYAVLDLAVERACPPRADLWCAEWSDSGRGA